MTRHNLVMFAAAGVGSSHEEVRVWTLTGAEEAVPIRNTVDLPEATDEWLLPRLRMDPAVDEVHLLEITGRLVVAGPMADGISELGPN